MGFDRVQESGALDVEEQCERFRASCHQRGIRVTPQRLAVYQALASDKTHPTADTLYERLARLMPGLARATVYRTLEFLENESLIRRVSGTEAVSRFDANLESHQHLVCRECGSLVDISLSEFNSPKLPEVPEFSVEEMDIRLVGRCGECTTTRTTSRGREPSIGTYERKGE